ncbi:MAG: LamG-like jellyroll fold domain-containing protein [Puniceicoccales bacterium]
MDDNLPDGVLTHHWEQLRGPGTASFTDPTALETNVTFDVPGVYEIGLFADDGAIADQDILMVRVEQPTGLALDDSAFGWWPGDSTYRDRIAFREMRGTDLPYAPFIEGVDGNAFAFEATSVLEIPAHVESVSRLGDGFTWEFWLAVNDIRPGRNYTVMQWNSADETKRVELSYNLPGSSTLGSRYFRVELEEDGETIVSESQLARNSYAINGEWRHIAIQYDPNAERFSLFVNGLLQADVAMPDFPVDGVVRLGKTSASSGLLGGIDELTLYERVLTPAEIYTLHLHGSSGKYLPTTNQAAIVYAGADRRVAIDQSVIELDGFAADDGLTNGCLLQSWRQLSGPATAELASPNEAVTEVILPLPGRYEFEFSASDGMAVTRDVISIVQGVICEHGLSDRAVAWWRGNYSPEDALGGAPVGIVGMGAAPYEDGFIGSAFSMPNTGYLATPIENDADRFAAGFSIEMWYRLDRITSNLHRTIFEWSDGETQLVLSHLERSVSGAPDYLVIQLLRNGETLVSELLATNHVRIEGQWYHLGARFDAASGSFDLFVDGEFADSTNLSDHTLPLNGALRFGAAKGMGNHEGAMDEIALYDYPIAGHDFYSIYQAGANGQCNTQANQPPVVDAGPRQGTFDPAMAAELIGSVSDDGLPSATTTVQWSQFSGPGTISFSDATALDSLAWADLPGKYVVRLTADDGDQTASDTTVLSFGLSCEASLAQSAISLWQGDGSARDSLGTNDAEFFSYSTPRYAEGQVATGFELNSGGYLRVSPYPNAETLFADGFAIDMWYRIDQISSIGNRAVFEWANSSVSLRVYHDEESGSGSPEYLVIQHFENGVQVVNEKVARSVLRNEGQWAHVTFSYAASDEMLNVYVNGSLEGAVDLEGLALPFDGELTFGTAEGLDPHIGAMDEIALYQGPLDVYDITAGYAAGAAGRCLLNENRPPVVNAGIDDSVSVDPVTLTGVLAGSVSDDGRPSNSLHIQWRQLSGPADAVTFADVSDPETSVTFATPGVYVLELSANDGVALARDVVTLRADAPCGFPAPANAVAWWPGDFNPTNALGGTPIDVTGTATNPYGVGLVGGGFIFNGSTAQTLEDVPALATLDPHPDLVEPA